MANPRKGSLVTTLLDRIVVPKPEYPRAVQDRLWADLRSRDDQWSARIIAAWLATDGKIRVAVVDTHGNVAEMYLTNVNLAVGGDVQEKI